MLILTKIKLAVAAVAVAGAVWAGWCVQGLRAENARLTEAKEALETALAESLRTRKADQAVAARHAKKVAALSTQKESENAKLRAALDAAPSWSASGVPPGVLDALRVPDIPEPE